MEFVAEPNVSRHAKIMTPVHTSRDAPPLPAALSSFSKGQQLGKGAFGTVYLAFHKPTGSECVMKEVALRGLDPSKLKSACAEVDVLRQLHHPFLVSYRGSVMDSPTQTLYIIMEYVDGGDLLTKIERMARAGRGLQPASAPRFGEADVLKLIVQCSDALAYCHHSLHLLHRDIKPPNILLTKNGDAKIGDFGISKSLAASHAQASTRCGSPVYMAPELCQSKPYDRAADAWSFGCTMYHICALRPPWVDQAGKTGIMGLVRTICNATLDLQSLRSHYSFTLCELIGSLVCKAAEGRPTFKEVLDKPFLQETVQHLYKGLGPEVYAIQRPDGTRTLPPSLSASPQRPSPPGTGKVPSVPAPATPLAPRPPTLLAAAKRLSGSFSNLLNRRPPPPSLAASPRRQPSPPLAAQPAPKVERVGDHWKVTAPTAVPIVARGTEEHVAAAVLQRSFQRMAMRSYKAPQGWSHAMNNRRAHNL